jgi:DNA-binding transcriptional regulator YhcF (GntR family)
MANNAPGNINVTQRAYEILEKTELVEIYRTKQKIYQTAIAVAISKNLPKFEGNEKLEHNIADTAALFNNSEFKLEYLLKLFGYTDENYVLEGMKLAEAGLRYLDEKIALGSDLFKILTEES